MINWKPIETAPKDDTVILLAKAGHDVAAGRWTGDEPEWKWRTFDGSCELDGWHEDRPTHWAEMPKAPK